MVYNKNDLIQKAKKEIALIRKKIKDKKKSLEKPKKNLIRLIDIQKKTWKTFISLTKKNEHKVKKNIEVEN